MLENAFGFFLQPRVAFCIRFQKFAQPLINVRTFLASAISPAVARWDFMKPVANPPPCRYRIADRSLACRGISHSAGKVPIIIRSVFMDLGKLAIRASLSAALRSFSMGAFQFVVALT
jgi:hypothetical protein